MDIVAYRDEIKLQLTGSVLELEIDDATIDRIIDSALREIQRYIDTTCIETVNFSRCIDLNPRKINTIVKVYRTEGVATNTSDGSISYDPMELSQWQIISGNSLNQKYIYNLASWNTTMQMRNTLATDMAFKYDPDKNFLYIVTSAGTPSRVTIEYIPRYENVADVKSDFWIDVLTQLSVAKAKIIVGRIRSRYTQSNALWQQDGETMLNEGTTELENLRDRLQASTQLSYPID